MRLIVKGLITCVLLFYIDLGQVHASNGDDVVDHRNFKKGVRLFDKGNFAQAGVQFQQLLDSGYHDSKLVTYMAQIHLELHAPHAAKHLILTVDSIQRNEDLNYLLAISHYYLEEFDDAKAVLSLVSDTSSYHLDHMKTQISNSVSHYQDSKGYIVQNFGSEVNSQYREYSAVMYNDFNELLYTTRNDTSEHLDRDGLAFEMIHDTSIDSLNNWHMADPFKFRFSHDKQHDATVQVYAKGTKLITYHNGKLYKSHLVDGVWIEDGLLKLHEFEGLDTHCFIADDESYIIFASDFQSYGHDLDLFISYKQSGGWSPPKAIKELNTEFNEDAPFLSEEGTLYFSSRGHGSLGGYDVFMTKYDSGVNRWSKPINLDYPINTVSEDIYYSAFGKVGFLSSTRVGGFGSLDIYKVLLFNQIKIEGVVKDELSKEPIPDVQIDLEYDSMYLRSYTDIQGEYEMYVPINKNMRITFIKDSLNLHSGEYYVDIFFRDKENREFNFLIPNIVSNEPITKGDLQVDREAKLIHIEVRNDLQSNVNIASISNEILPHWTDSLNLQYEKIHHKNNSRESGLVTVFFDYNSYDLDSLSQNELRVFYDQVLMKNNFTVEISGHTDNRGSQQFNQKLSLKRAMSVYQYLLARGLSGDKVAVNGYGEAQLILDDDNEKTHAENRRVEIHFY